MRGIDGERYVFIEIGHPAHNVLLQGQSLGPGTGAVGAFMDRGLDTIFELPRDESALYGLSHIA